MIIKKHLKFTAKKISNLFTAVIISLSLIIFILVSVFLYNNFYQVITQAKEILTLKGKVALETVNLEKFNLIMEKLAEKTSSKEAKNITSPFN
ncbi:MAG: hypothetical protein Q7R92_00160 [bacterium]|nr:hypothetical protein [bacterium]